MKIADPSRVHLSLGSNLGDRLQTIRHALADIHQLPGTTVTKVSSIHETEPWGHIPQPAFLNCACEVRTILPPLELLAALQAIEARHGRVRVERWGPRTLDIDILLVDDSSIAVPTLTVPHPRIAERAFVLRPLAEIAPDVMVPGTGSTVAALLQACPDQGAVRVVAPHSSITEAPTAASTSHP